MIVRNHIAASALVLVISLLAGCASDDPVANSETSGANQLSIPSIEEVARAVSLDAEDRAMVAEALEVWGAASHARGFNHRGGMQFIATVAPALDNRQSPTWSICFANTARSVGRSIARVLAMTETVMLT